MGAALSTVFVIQVLAGQARSEAAKEMYGPGGGLVLGAIIDLTLFLVVTGVVIALAGTALFARHLARRGRPLHRSVAAALGGALGGVALSLLHLASLLALHVFWGFNSGRTFLLVVTLFVVGGGVLGWSCEAVFRFRERRAASHMSSGADLSAPPEEQAND